MRLGDTYHPGERAVQRRAGEVEQADRSSRVVGNAIGGGALHFLERQTMISIGGFGVDDQIWCSVLYGSPGFVRVRAGTTVEIAVRSSSAGDDDPVLAQAAIGSNLGMLAIDLENRGRLRINGRISGLDAGVLRLTVDAAYPNCPQYIQRRRLLISPLIDLPPARSSSGDRLEPSQIRRIQSADTFFVTTFHASQGFDSSHRGGPSGFVQVGTDGVLCIPDYPGNSMFNTLGNIQLQPRAGLVFPDFESSSLLHLSGEASLAWDRNDPDGRTAGTNRFWTFVTRRWKRTRASARLSWEYLEASPDNPRMRPGSGARRRG